MAPTLATSSNYTTFPQAQTMAEFPKACHDMLRWDELLTDKEKETKYKVRKFAVSDTSLNMVCIYAFMLECWKVAVAQSNSIQSWGSELYINSHYSHYVIE